MKTRALAFAGLFGCGTCQAQMELPAHPPPASIGASAPAALLFDLEATSDPVVVDAITMSTFAAAGQTFQFELLIRDGSCLGGSTTTGPGSSLDGWTALGVVEGVQGLENGGVSQQIELPRFEVRPGHTVGVALWFETVGGPRVFRDPLVQNEIFEDGALRLTSGEAWAYPFTNGPFRFRGCVLVGSIFYQLDPCYPNCDFSTTPPTLNVNDFLCFMGKFAAGDSYANCDQSTTPPVLNVNDFLCFTQQFAGGCS